MSNEKDILILTLSPSLKRQRTEEGKQFIKAMYRSLIHFLQNNDLTTRIILEGNDLPDDFRLWKSDLTDLGFRVVQKDLTKWLDSVSGGKTEIEDLGILERKLAKLK